MDAWSRKLSIFHIFRWFQKQTLLFFFFLAVSGCELFCLGVPWVSSCERAAAITSALSDVHTWFFNFSKKGSQFETSAKKDVFQSSLRSVTLLSFFTRRDLSRLYQSWLPPINWCIWRGEMFGRLQRVMWWEGEQQCGASGAGWDLWMRDKEWESERERRGERRGEMVCGCQATIDNQIPKHHACGALPSLQAWKSLSFSHIHTLSHRVNIFTLIIQ